MKMKKVLFLYLLTFITAHANPVCEDLVCCNNNCCDSSQRNTNLSNGPNANQCYSCVNGSKIAYLKDYDESNNCYKTFDYCEEI